MAGNKGFPQAAVLYALDRRSPVEFSFPNSQYAMPFRVNIVESPHELE